MQVRIRILEHEGSVVEREKKKQKRETRPRQKRVNETPMTGKLEKGG